MDSRMKKTKSKKTDDPIAVTAQMSNELECLKKLISVYQKEIFKLKEQLDERTGYDKVMEVDKKIIEAKEKYEELLSTKRELEKQVKGSGKLLNKEDYRKENGIPQLEVRFLL